MPKIFTKEHYWGICGAFFFCLCSSCCILEDLNLGGNQEIGKTHRDVEGGVHEDVEDCPDGKVDPEGETVRALLLTSSTVFKINPDALRRKILSEIRAYLKVGLHHRSHFHFLLWNDGWHSLTYSYPDNIVNHNRGRKWLGLTCNSGLWHWQGQIENCNRGHKWLGLHIGLPCLWSTRLLGQPSENLRNRRRNNQMENFTQIKN